MRMCVTHETGNLSEKCGLLFWSKAGSRYKVYEEAKKGKPVYTYGPIIHNEEVVQDLEEQRSKSSRTARKNLKNIAEGNCRDPFPWSGKRSL